MPPCAVHLDISLIPHHIATQQEGFFGMARLFGRGSEATFKVQRTENEWRHLLTPRQYHVLRRHGTERAGTSPLNDEKRAGVFACAGCGKDLFDSATRYESGTGWPSFWQPIEGAVATSEDRGFFMTRVEVHCADCGGHLGHVFPDGPKPTGERYCMNGVSLTFRPV